MGILNLAVFLIVIFASYVLSIHTGFRIGLKSGKKAYDDHTAAHVSSLQAAIFGLLALLLGFTFSMAIQRYDIRKELVVKEAEMIADTYQMADFLPAREEQQTRLLIKDYVKARLGFYKAGNNLPKIAEANAQALGIKNKIWDIAANVMKNTSHPVPVSIFIKSLSEMMDMTETRTAALENHVPKSVLWLLFFTSTLGMGFVGYTAGLTGKRQHATTAFFAFLLALVLVIILDIDRPRDGLIQVSQDSLLRIETYIEKSPE